MEALTECFRVIITDSNMKAFVNCKNSLQSLDVNLKVDVNHWKTFLHHNKVTFGIQNQALQQLVKNPNTVTYPILIAEGSNPKNGENGKIEYKTQFEKEIKRNESWDFRDIMKIPSVEAGDKLATLIKPTKGSDGTNVKNERVKAKKGKPVIFQSGKNVEYREEDESFYAMGAGQFSVTGEKLHVHPEYLVNETLSMKSGNLDFVGTIIIHGDVPTGYTVKAEGDIKIYGLVEGANVIAGGSIYISEGISGQGKCFLKSGEDMRVGYINQAHILVGEDLYVENSILHSESTVYGHVYSQRGNIIGGSISAGKTIEARNIGTHWNTKTKIVFGLSKALMEKEEELLKKKDQLKNTLSKLLILNEKLKNQDSSDPKVRLSMLRTHNTYERTNEQLKEVNHSLKKINVTLGNITEAKLLVRNFIYQNVEVSFGKYKQILKNDHHYIQMNLEGKEIVTHPLYS